MSSENERAAFIQWIEEHPPDADYPAEAFWFVRQGYYCVATLDQVGRHIAGGELCWRLRDLAINQFGPHARERLGDWSIVSCHDFGRIVFALVDAGLMEATQQDSIDDFQDVYDFDDAFPLDAPWPPARRPLQWRLSTMFILTTVGAIAFAGFAKLGLGGAVASVMSVWIGLIAIVCLVHAKTERSRDSLVAACIGLFLLALAVVMFLGVITANRME